MKNSLIYSTGSFLPESVVHNEDLTQFPSAALGLIAQKTGVLSRRVAQREECTSDLAIKAARTCLDRTGFPAERIDGIILSTSSPDRMQPATATRVQYELGATSAFAFDINSVCSGSTYGISLADSLIRSGQCETVLFVAAEMYSKILCKKDFSTSPFFGDAAGAILFRAGNSGRGVLHSLLKTDGSANGAVCVPAGGTMMPYEKMTNPRLAYFRMNGTAVYDFAVSRGTEIILNLIQAAGLCVADIDSVICHQANINIIQEISCRTGIQFGKFFINIHRYGNTASASVLVALDEAVTGKVINKGNLVVTVAFGGGLSWGANLIRM